MKINEENWIVRFFYTWGALPWRKPLVMFSCLNFLAMEWVSLVTGKDIPMLMGEIFKGYMFTIIVAAFGSSSFETWSGKKKVGNDEPQSNDQ